MGEPDINKILAHAGIIGFEKLGRKTITKIKKLWFKGQFGITLSPEEANKLKRISETPTYRLYRRCVGNNLYTPYIKLGMLIYELTILGDRKRVSEIRKEISCTKKQKFRKIIHIGSTGIIPHILEYLVNLKEDKNFSKESTY